MSHLPTSQSSERLVEHDWTPHRDVVVQQQPIMCLNSMVCMCEKQTGGYGFISISNSTISTAITITITITIKITITITITITIPITITITITSTPPTSRLVPGTSVSFLSRAKYSIVQYSIY